MAYIGRQLDAGNYLKLDDISSQFNGSTVRFNLTSGGNPYYPGSPFSILVSLGGVIQEPSSAYEIDENQIIFAVAPQSTDDFFCISLGEALGVGVPADGSVTFAKLAPSARGVGIQSGGVNIGVGVTQLNFIGFGNTFAYNSSTNSIDVSISGNAGAGGTFSANAVGVHTTKILGINTTTIAGAANSEGALQVVGNIAVTDGAVLTDQTVDGMITIPAGKNGLIIGPAAVSLGSTIIVETGSTLVIV
jgi:hypothetical protein